MHSSKYNFKNIELIPAFEIEIIYDKNKTKGCDMTVKNNFTFSTFDGVFVEDTMAVFAVLSEEAQQEIKTQMVSATGANHTNDMNFSLTQEMITGVFTLTYYDDKNHPTTINKIQDISKYDIGHNIIIDYKGAKRRTTVGKILFNNTLPEWFPYVDYPVDKKQLKRLMQQVISKNQADFVKTIDVLMRLAFKYATQHPLSFSLDMMTISPKLEQLKLDLAKEKDVGKQSKIISEMEDELVDFLKIAHPDLYIQVASGASKGKEQIRQIMVAKGLISDPKGNVLPPITRSLAEGYTPEEYFKASAGSRKGTIDRALNTAFGGYSARKTLYIVSDVMLNKEVKNCGTRRGLKVKLTKEIFDKMGGRNVITGVDKYEPISEKMIGKTVEIRSPVFCKTRDVCPVCYGNLFQQVRSRNIGVLASSVTNLSERIMKCSVGMIHSDTKGFVTFDDVWENTAWEEL
jgi:DNA-directed RNA polymerase subunit beta'